MKLSRLIKHLQKIQEKYGDIEVIVEYGPRYDIQRSPLEQLPSVITPKTDPRLRLF